MKLFVFINRTGVGASNFAKNLDVCPAAYCVNVQDGRWTVRSGLVHLAEEA
jgi:hypothetical protein